MTVNNVNIRMEEESLNIASINLLVRFHKAREIFPSVTQVSPSSSSYQCKSRKIEFERACTKGSMFESGCQLCAEVNSLQQ